MLSGPSPRAFELRSQVWFRTSRDTAWRAGTSRCISARGAVVHADDPPPVLDVVEIVIALSDRGCLVGRGRVMRAYPTDGIGRSADFSITVGRFSITHRHTALGLYSTVLHGC